MDSSRLPGPAGSPSYNPQRGGEPQPGPTLSFHIRAIHGSAFDITGKGIANPIATFWTAVLMLEHLGEKDAAQRLMRAIERVTGNGIHTPDLGGEATTEIVTSAFATRCRNVMGAQSGAATISQ